MEARTAHRDPELDDLVRRCARVRRGLAFLHRAPVESVAVTLGVHPGAVERVRALLEDPAQRAVAIAAFIAVSARASGASGSRGADDPVLPRCCEDLVRVAERRPGGLDLLADAALETAAIAFGVHPRLVLEARRTLAHG